jgi:hypothetical protein
MEKSLVNLHSAAAAAHRSLRAISRVDVVHVIVTGRGRGSSLSTRVRRVFVVNGVDGNRTLCAIDVGLESFVEVGCAPTGHDNGYEHQEDGDDGEDGEGPASGEIIIATRATCVHSGEFEEEIGKGSEICNL